MWFAVVPAKTGLISLVGTSPHVPHWPSSSNQKSGLPTESSRSKSVRTEPNGIYAPENHLSSEKYKGWWFSCKFPQYLVEIEVDNGRGDTSLRYREGACKSSRLMDFTRKARKVPFSAFWSGLTSPVSASR
jgi:hypothetical protein